MFAGWNERARARAAARKEPEYPEYTEEPEYPEYIEVPDTSENPKTARAVAIANLRTFQVALAYAEAQFDQPFMYGQVAEGVAYASPRRMRGVSKSEALAWATNQPVDALEWVLEYGLHLRSRGELFNPPED